MINAQQQNSLNYKNNSNANDHNKNINESNNDAYGKQGLKKNQHYESMPNGLTANHNIQNNIRRQENGIQSDVLKTPTHQNQSQQKIKLNKLKARKGHKQTLTNLTEMGKQNDLKSENKKLRMFNQSLKKQLQVFERRLDDSIRKRVISEKKPKVNYEAVQNMQLQNAYKQIQIYKRDISNMKKKQVFYTENKVDQLQNQLQLMQKQRQQLLKQLKIMQKSNRIQQKKIKQLTGADISKVFSENQLLKQENKKLSQKYAKQDRTDKLVKISASNQKKRAKELQQRKQEQMKKQEQRQKSQIEILKKKSAKDNIKIANLMAENSKMRQNMENLRQQLVDKDKDNLALRDRLARLRKQYRSKTVVHYQTQPSKTVQAEQQKAQLPSNQFQAKTINMKQQNSIQGKYPKLIDAGSKMQQSFKWNHHQFSSPIKQVQVLLNNDNTIKQINFRYEKGQPNRQSNAKYTVFSCDNGQYVKIIQGGFYQSKLQYIALKTNIGRVQSFGNQNYAPKCQNFTFGGHDNQFPGAFFGENISTGINRIGCLIELIK